MYVPVISGNSLHEQNHYDKKLGEVDGFNIKETVYIDAETRFILPN